MERRSQLELSVEHEDGAAVLDVASGTITTLNSTGAFVWQRLRDGEPIEVICRSLANATGEMFHVVERDVQEFLQILEQAQPPA